MVLMFCDTPPSDHCLLPVREISPFFFTSNLGLIYPRNNPHVPDVINRLRQLYEGNFDFLTLVETNLRLQAKVETNLRLQAKVAELETALKHHKSSITSLPN